MDYRIHLKQFDGPLDLLLHLIEKASLDIRDIFVSEITSEFLSYMNELDELDMDAASEFLTVAATLIYMKSRSLVPNVKKEEADGDDGTEDPGEALIRQLREYKMFKEAAEKMRELAHGASFMRTKKPEEFPLPPKQITLKDTDINSLFRALLTALSRYEEPEGEAPVYEVSREKYTVRACAHEIREKLLQNGKARFTELITGAERAKAVVIFMTLLEMIFAGEIRITQKRYCGDISIKAVNLLSDDAKLNYMDEDEAD